MKTRKTERAGRAEYKINFLDARDVRLWHRPVRRSCTVDVGTGSATQEHF